MLTVLWDLKDVLNSRQNRSKNKRSVKTPWQEYMEVARSGYGLLTCLRVCAENTAGLATGPEVLVELNFCSSISNFWSIYFSSFITRHLAGGYHVQKTKVDQETQHYLLYKYYNDDTNE